MDFSQIPATFGRQALFVVISVLLIWIAKIIADRRTTEFNDDIQIDNGNRAVGIRRAGFYLSVAIALSGALSGVSKGLWMDTVWLLIDGGLILFCLFASRFFNDRIMLANIDNDTECMRLFKNQSGIKEKGNTTVGIVECGMYIATGFILSGSLSGASISLAESILSTLLFFVLGQAALLFFGFVYQLITPFNVREQIKANNPAAGIGLAGMLIALGIILFASIRGPFTGWISDITSFGIYTAYGMVMLIIFRFVIDRLLLPTTNLAVEITEDRNTAALVVAESAIVAVAVIIAFSM